MAALSTNRIAWTYTDDAGNSWRVAAQKAITDQGVCGGSAAAASVPPKPASIKMRRATVRNPSYGSRTVVLYDATQTLVKPAGTSQGTVNLNWLGSSYAFTAEGTLISEKRPRQSVTMQAS